MARGSARTPGGPTAAATAGAAADQPRSTSELTRALPGYLRPTVSSTNRKQLTEKQSSSSKEKKAAMNEANERMLKQRLAAEKSKVRRQALSIVKKRLRKITESLSSHIQYYIDDIETIIKKEDASKRDLQTAEQDFLRASYSFTDARGGTFEQGEKALEKGLVLVKLQYEMCAKTAAAQAALRRADQLELELENAKIREEAAQVRAKALAALLRDATETRQEAIDAQQADEHFDLEIEQSTAALAEFNASLDEDLRDSADELALVAKQRDDAAAGTAQLQEKLQHLEDEFNSLISSESDRSTSPATSPTTALGTPTDSSPSIQPPKKANELIVDEISFAPDNEWAFALSTADEKMTSPGTPSTLSRSRPLSPPSATPPGTPPPARTARVMAAETLVDEISFANDGTISPCASRGCGARLSSKFRPARKPRSSVRETAHEETDEEKFEAGYEPDSDDSGSESDSSVSETAHEDTYEETDTGYDPESDESGSEFDSESDYDDSDDSSSETDSKKRANRIKRSREFSKQKQRAEVQAWRERNMDGELVQDFFRAQGHPVSKSSLKMLWNEIFPDADSRPCSPDSLAFSEDEVDEVVDGELDEEADDVVIEAAS